MELEDTCFVSQRKRRGTLGPSASKKVHSHGYESRVHPQSVELLKYCLWSKLDQITSFINMSTRGTLSNSFKTWFPQVVRFQYTTLRTVTACIFRKSAKDYYIYSGITKALIVFFTIAWWKISVGKTVCCAGHDTLAWTLPLPPCFPCDMGGSRSFSTDTWKNS